MKPAERAVAFACGADTLFGILSEPGAGQAASGVGVVVVVGGPQYRVGAHRQFVQLARRLTAAGHAVLRFDVRGMGDSTGAQRSFEALDDDIAAAIGALLAQAPQVRSVTLWGLCDGASAALTYLARRPDARVRALCLLNPWLRSEETLAKTHVKHYYRQRLAQPDFWLKLLKGGVAAKAAQDLWHNLRLSAGAAKGAGAGSTEAPPADFRTLMARGWHAFKGPMLLVTSDDDYTAREFIEGCASHPAWRGALVKPGLRRVQLADADHTLSDFTARLTLEAAVADWLRLKVATPSGMRSEEAA